MGPLSAWAWWPTDNKANDMVGVFTIVHDSMATACGILEELPYDFAWALHRQRQRDQGKKSISLCLPPVLNRSVICVIQATSHAAKQYVGRRQATRSYLTGPLRLIERVQVRETGYEVLPDWVKGPDSNTMGAPSNPGDASLLS